ncbi:P-loop containing nucleoside triphosphate hydrolases superfamily protein [Perilla frutescens var. hirtella]|uniref:P-loop containing nucleoside triphosphate hydrolases superfamily protein n=1 Tax=Perilla frutescens var. hirtella TaxID=608512 RepID=A0AAD4J659_PERFH|nr:P-loop containing nucleoside triphosphate hydrolases superfamily protein [Perilla frutescens var. hirtella]
MGSKGRLLFDLNEPPAENEDDNDGVVCFQPQRAIPSITATTDLFVASAGPQGIVNNHAFSHASSVSGFQPFIRSKSGQGPDLAAEKKSFMDTLTNVASSSKSRIGQDMKASPIIQSGLLDAPDVEKEEGEWSDAEGSVDAYKRTVLREDSSGASDKQVSEKSTVEMIESNVLTGGVDNISPNHGSVKNENGGPPSGQNPETNDKKSDASTDGLEESAPAQKQREVRGIEANHALKYGNSLGKRPKLDQQKEAMLGKKRSRQTMFLNLEDIKQAGVLKSTTPRRQIPAPTITRTVKEGRPALAFSDRGDKQTQPIVRDTKQPDLLSNEGNNFVESNECKSENNGDYSSGSIGPPRRFNSATDVSSEGQTPVVPRSGSWKLPPDTRQHKNSQFSGRKPAISSQTSTDLKLAAKKLPSKKQTTTSNQYQDTSVERLLREVTNEKFWHHPEEEELQRVPGSFDSVEEYIRVFEPLLFEECRAQLYSTWEESLETVSNHVRVCIKSIDRRERGWYDVILIPPHEHKWTFKEGDVAVLSSPKPGAVHIRRNNSLALEDEEKPEVSGRIAGTVRRYIPIDTREYTGAILHFYVGDLYDSSSKIDDDHILRKLHPGGVWHLTQLGSLATTQREYVALHAFRRLNVQMQNAILQPSPDQFPKYEEQPPAMPDCFTPNFVEHLRRTFNGPQLAAIQWAAMHTAAGTSAGVTKKSEPWPFTLVQGPPGTGKTHTVWGMLNVIHLVQYQHYYTALLKKLAPESYKQVSESNSDSVATGSIDEVLQSMDQNLFRTLPKLCPKPRMLVCAPSNAATDELLSRVLDRGFIDGEMKVYRPDVARVGVDSQTRAAQAVSVERRTEQLLSKSRDEVHGWMHSLRIRETQLSQQIACLQRELNVAAATGRAQGSVGVDPDVLIARDQNRDSLLQNLAAAVENRDKTLVEMSRLLIVEGRFRAGSNFNLEEARANLEASFANEAEIVFTTVSSSGRKLFSRLTHGFDMVVIDEAAQASEVGILPPLSLGAARCVLVGDPQQLPATVISKAAGTLLYSRSLFERFQLAGCPTMLLSVQYRMHPHIRDFPSRHFYQGRLTDSESVANLPDEIYYKDTLLRPYIFFDIAFGRESHRGGSVSYQNTQEAQFCVRLYEHLQKTIKSLGIGKVTVGIITPYKLQLKCLQREFKDVLNSDEGKDIYINTVDAFQGQERDVIIMSCVRASSHGVGFVADIRRMNVALTRARRALWVMGNASALVQSDDWASLIDDAKTRNCYLDMDSLPKEFIPETSIYSTFSSKISGARGLRSGPRYRSYDSQVESRSGTPSEEDEKSNLSKISRNGSYRSLRPGAENSLDDFDQSSDKFRDAWQHGIQKKQNAAGVLGKRDL